MLPSSNLPFDDKCHHAVEWFLWQFLRSFLLNYLIHIIAKQITKINMNHSFLSPDQTCMILPADSCALNSSSCLEENGLWYHYLMVAKDRETLAISKWITLKFYMERYNLKKLNNIQSTVELKISNQSAALENSDGDVNMWIVTASGTILKRIYKFLPRRV